MSNPARSSLTRLAIVLVGSLLLAACDREPTAPGARRAVSPPDAARRDSSLTCRSGYIIVDGRMVCAEQ